MDLRDERESLQHDMVDSLLRDSDVGEYLSKVLPPLSGVLLDALVEKEPHLQQTGVARWLKIGSILLDNRITEPDLRVSTFDKLIKRRPDSGRELRVLLYDIEQCNMVTATFLHDGNSIFQGDPYYLNKLSKWNLSMVPRVNLNELYTGNQTFVHPWYETTYYKTSPWSPADCVVDDNDFNPALIKFLSEQIRVGKNLVARDLATQRQKEEQQLEDLRSLKKTLAL